MQIVKEYNAARKVVFIIYAAAYISAWSWVLYSRLTRLTLVCLLVSAVLVPLFFLICPGRPRKTALRTLTGSFLLSLAIFLCFKTTVCAYYQRLTPGIFIGKVAQTYTVLCRPLEFVYSWDSEVDHLKESWRSRTGFGTSARSRANNATP